MSVVIGIVLSSLSIVAPTVNRSCDEVVVVVVVVENRIGTALVAWITVVSLVDLMTVDSDVDLVVVVTIETIAVLVTEV